MTELIQVKQLPVIEERLREVKDYVDAAVEEAMSMVCTEETLQAVKAARSDLNKRFGELEEQRKAVKTAVMAPYERFDAVYKECVSDAFKRADTHMKQKVNDVENDMKRRCEEGLRDYFAELCAAHHIEFVPYERAGIVVSMTDAKAKTQPPKRLREQLKQFATKVELDVATISGMADAEEIMAEYKKCYDTTAAIGAVMERHKRIEEERDAATKRAEIRSREVEVVKRVEAFAPPVVAPVEARKLLCVTFTVTDTRERLKMLKQFLEANGYKYE